MIDPSNPFYFGWACVAPNWGSPPNFIHTNSVRARREDAQAEIGEAWAREGETPRQGWKRAYRIGWRCRRVAVRLAGGSNAS